MGLDFQPDGLTAGLAEHCQPDKKYPKSQKEKGMIFLLHDLTSSARCQNDKRLYTNVSLKFKRVNRQPDR